jgi:hypothetical protein
LDEYETHAKAMGYSTSLGIEAIKRLYETNQYEPLNILRNLGAQAISSSLFLKGVLANNANFHILGPRKFEWTD